MAVATLRHTSILVQGAGEYRDVGCVANVEKLALRRNFSHFSPICGGYPFSFLRHEILSEHRATPSPLLREGPPGSAGPGGGGFAT